MNPTRRHDTDGRPHLIGPRPWPGLRRCNTCGGRGYRRNGARCAACGTGGVIAR